MIDKREGLIALICVVVGMTVNLIGGIPMLVGVGIGVLLMAVVTFLWRK